MSSSQLEAEAAIRKLQSQDATIKELRAFIDEHGLGDQVSKGIGGKKRRTKKDMTDDIIRAISAEDHPSRVPPDVFKREIDRLPVVGLDAAAAEVRKQLLMMVRMLSEHTETTAQARRMITKIAKELDLE